MKRRNFLAGLASLALAPFIGITKLATAQEEVPKLPDTWPQAPIDVKWDDDKKVWVSLHDKGLISDKTLLDAVSMPTGQAFEFVPTKGNPSKNYTTLQDWVEGSGDSPYAPMTANLEVSVDLDREEIYELGRKGPYSRYVNFPLGADVVEYDLEEIEEIVDKLPMYVSSIGYSFPIDDNPTEEITMVGNTRVWKGPENEA